MTIAPIHRRRLHRLVRLGLASAAMLIVVQPAAGQLGQQHPVGAPTNSAAPAPMAPQADQQIEAYPLNDATRDVLLAWQQYANGRQELRVAIDERSAQALVIAPAAIQSQIRQQLSTRVAAAPQRNAGDAAAADAVYVQLRTLPPPELHARLERLVARPLPARVDGSGEWLSFAVEAAAGAGVMMHVNNRTGHVRIDGAAEHVDAWRSVVEALDSPPPAPGTVTQLVSTKRANQEHLRKSLRALQASASGNEPQSMVSMLFQQRGEDASGAGAGAQRGDQSPRLAQQPAAPPADERLEVAREAARLAEEAGGLLGPVQVEFVEGLDVIVLRGAERDVERVMEIIRQIEELAAVIVPAIEVHELRHVDSLQMAALLMRLYEPEGVLGVRIGAVSITPLVKPNALLLIGRPENVRTAIELIERLDQPVTPTARFQVFPLQHAAALEAKALIDGFLGQGDVQPPQDAVTDATQDIPTLAPRALVVADIRTNSLIISAGPRDMAEIAALIARIDTPGAVAELKVFTIINGDAAALAEVLRSLFVAPVDPAAPGLAPPGVRMQFSVDQRTNSIIAIGSREDLAVVEAILLRLDEGDLRERITRVHKLNNAYAENVAAALNQWLQTERQVEQIIDVVVSPFQQIEREVVVVPELATNSVIVSATPRFFEEVMRIIRDLDERPPMVLIQVLIAEVRLNDTDEFGVELGLQDSLLFDRSLLSEVQTIAVTDSVPGTGVQTTTQQIISAAGTPGFLFNNAPLGNNVASGRALARSGNVAPQGLSHFALGRTNPELGFGGFVFSASSSSVSVLLRALQEKRRLEVLSRPQLMALDGQPGQVQVGQNVPRIIATQIDPLAGQVNTIAYEPVGLILQVVPRISPDGLVVMAITANKSEVGPEAEGIPISITPAGDVLRAPRIEISQALTTVSALSGQTVILGGLLQTRRFDVHRRVPLLADIPLLGALFRFDSVSEERRELLIVLTPHIIYNKFDSDLVKQIESSRMSWILSDVVNLHGEAGLRSRCDAWAEGELDSLYPGYVPLPEEGVLPLSPHSAPPIHGPVWEPMAPHASPQFVEPLPTPPAP